MCKQDGYGWDLECHYYHNRQGTQYGIVPPVCVAL